GLSHLEFLLLSGRGTQSLTFGANASAAFGSKLTVLGTLAEALNLNGSALGAGTQLVVYGGAGPDTMRGGAANDVFFLKAAAGLAAGRIIDGGAGRDILTLQFDAALTDANFVGLSRLETLILNGTGASTLTVGANAATAFGGGLTLYGGTAASLNLDARSFAAGQALYVEGTAGADTLRGGAGNDALRGGLGNDVIVGGAGNDGLTGGAGADIFVADTVSYDAVNDFVHGTDRIDLTAAGYTSFAQAMARTVQIGSDTVINTAAGAAIRLVGVSRSILTAGDFILAGGGTPNQAPTAVTLSAATVAENAAGAAIGTLGVVDPNDAGGFTFALSDSRFEVSGTTLKLKAGVSLDFEAAASLPLTVTATDPGGLSKAQAFTITVTNVNEAATIGGTGTGSVAEDGTLTAGAALTVTDPDAGQSRFATPASLAGTYGTFSFNATSGAWGYALANAQTNVQALKAGQSVTDSLTVASLDGTASRAIVVTIAGANDAATIGGTAIGAVTEDGTLTASAALAIADPDTGEARFAAPASLAGSYGTFSFNAMSGAWGYALANAQASVQALKAGQSVTDSLTVASFDGTASKAIVVTIAGANDAATIGGTSTGAVTEDLGFLPPIGQLTIADTDVGEAAFATPASLAGTYGDFIFIAPTGLWSYVLRDGAANVQALSAGQLVTDSLTVTSLDGTASKAIVVTVTGANDAPVAADVALGTVAIHDVGGQLAADDIDGDDDAASLIYTLVNPVAAGKGTLSLGAGGAFVFDPNGAFDGLAAGATETLTLDWRATDRHGASSATQHLTITVTGVGPAPGTPTITGFSQDTGVVGDRLTADQTLVVSGTGTAGLTIGLLAGSTDFGTTTVAADGTWSVALSGPLLADGSYNFTAREFDAYGRIGGFATPFAVTVDATAPAAPSVGLAASSDTGTVGDGITSLGRVTLVGTGEAGATVEFVGSGTLALVAGDGSFVLPDVALAAGANALNIRIVDTAGNTTTTTLALTRQSADPGTDPVLAWNTMALNTIRADASAPAYATRALAMESIAVLDTLAAIDGTPAFLVGLSAPAGIPAAAAVAAAAHTVLSHLYPAQHVALDAKLAADLVGIPAGAARDTAVAFGTAVADAVIALRDKDGWDSFVTYDGGTDPGEWRPTLPAYALADAPQWGTLTPFALQTGDQFRPDGPPALDSAEYAAALAEVQSLGSATSATRTAEQTQIARFWADGLGTYTPPGHWNAIADQVAADAGYGLGSAARLLAILNVALADSSIAAWDTKYAFGGWRPVTAIREADTDGNPATTADPAWQPLLITPNHPEYVSGHSTYSAAAADVLTALLGQVAFSTTSPGLPGVTRSFSSFEAAAVEAGVSRIYGGIHFSFSNTDGQALGQDVADWVLDAFRTDSDTRAPTITIDQERGGTATDAPVLTGYALDNLSGLATATATLDGSSAVTVTVDGRGRFSLDLDTAFGTIGDGTHTVRLGATDGAGNTASPASFTFTVDTRAPTITLDGLADGATIVAGAHLAGTADGTDSALTVLGYRWDGEATDRPLVYDRATGTFDAALDLRTLLPGTHTLTVTAKDAAGLVTASAITVNLPNAVPFSVASVTPLDEAGDVGVTVQPQVSFTRAVDAATLTAGSFWATDAAGAVLPGNIVLSDDATKAWLFLQQAMPGATQVTLHLDGEAIRAAGDGVLLDGDGDGTPGGDLASSFQTVSRTIVPGTSLTGFITGPGADLKPMTFDDFRAGPDGAAHTADDVFLERLTGVKVYILGLEDKAVYTDAQGRFTLDEVPTGVVKVAIDGRTATNAPDGSFFPEMVMDITIRPGQVNTIMGSMGTTESQLENAGRGEVYLPRIPLSVLTEIAGDAPTVVRTPVEGAPNITEAERELITLVVQPGSVVDANGQPLADAQIGIATVPPELVRDMLPTGLLQHTFDLTIQAPGAAGFTTPLQLTLPNVFNAAPGTKLNLLSFDHTTGRLVIDGTGTVSEDGLYVVTDPDTGVTKPGWHGMTPPGNCAGDGGAPPPPPKPTPNDTEATLAPQILNLVTGDAAANIFKKEWKAPEKLPDTPPDGGGQWAVPNAPKDPAGKKQPYLKVEIKIDGLLADYMKKTGNVDLTNTSFTLTAGSGKTKTLSFDAKSFADLITGGLKNVEKDILYGSKISITEVTGKSDGSTDTKKQDIYVTRYVDASDDNHTDATAEFNAAIVNGVARERDVEVKAGSTGLAMAIQGGADFAASASKLTFDPTGEGTKTGNLKFAYSGGVQVGQTLALKGVGAPVQHFFIDKAGIIATLKAIADGTAADITAQTTAAEKALFDDKDAAGNATNERSAIADAIAAKVASILSTAAPGLTAGAAGAADLMTVRFLTTARSGLLGDSAPAGGIDNAAQIGQVVANRFSLSATENGFRLDKAVNQGYSGTIDAYVNTPLEVRDITSVAQLVNTLAKTAAHEIGHTLGLTHTFSASTGQTVTINGVSGQTDLMAQGIDTAGSLIITSITRGAVLLASNIGYATSDARNALSYYIQNPGNFDAVEGTNEAAGQRDAPAGAHLALFDADTGLLIGNLVDFGAGLVDGTGGNIVTLHLSLLNFGADPLTLGALGLSGGAFRATLPASGTTLAPGATLPFDLIFDPGMVGALSGTLHVDSNDDATDGDIKLLGTGQSPTPFLSVDAFDNDLGGVDLGDTAFDPAVYTISNQGAAPLVISGIAFAPGASGFSLVGVPGNLATAPITLNYGDSFSFGAAYTAGEVGLAAGQILVTSNAANTPTLSLSTVATGYDAAYNFDWGDDYIAVDVNGITLRAKSDAQGHFSLFLSAQTDYDIVVFDPETGLIAHNQGRTPQSGIGVNLSSGLVFEPGSAADSDFDGLADDIEHAIGTSPTNRDSNADGITEFNSLRLGIDPLAGVSLPTGIIASLSLNGTARDITLALDLAGTGSRTALVANGAAGVAVVDVGNPLSPRVLATLDLPGDARALAFDPITKVAVVATTSTLELVSLANVAAPKVLASVAAGAQAVQVLDGIAYATVGSSLQAYDLQTGAALGSLALGGTLTGLAREETHLYTLDSSGTVRAVRLVGDGSMVAEGTLSLPGNGQSWA
ncbi:MAG: VCBS domain-containing protein, partial [Paracraurococcus sp.]